MKRWGFVRVLAGCAVAGFVGAGVSGCDDSDDDSTMKAAKADAVAQVHAAAAARDGGGFVDYYWIKPGETGEKLKIGYVEPIPGSDYFIGSGVYIE